MTDSLDRRRIGLLFVCFFVMAVVLSGRLVYWQVLRRAELVEQATAQVRQAESVAARRGHIYDHDGNLLATTVALNSVYALPRHVSEKSQVARALSRALGSDAEVIRAKLESGAEWIYLARRVPEEASAVVRALEIPGIGLQPEPKRVYPNDRVAAALLGFVNDDGAGQSGVEARYDKVLGGVPGRLVLERDPARRALAVGVRELEPAIDGADLVLTLDLVIQNAAERELERAVKAEKATGGTIIVLEPDTGAILAIASTPGFDPNAFSRADPEGFRDRAVSWTYEPGSTLKSVTIAAALNEHAVEPRTTYEDRGYAVIGGRTLHNAQGRVYGVLDISGILERSANAGAVFVAQRLGADRLYRYLMDFGFGRPTGVDLAAEAAGAVRRLDDWYPVDVGTAAFGQGLSVTPLQLAAAYGAIANGGTLYRPYVVAELRSPSGVQRVAPQAIRRVIAPETAATMRELLTNAIDRGIAQGASVVGYSVAGKTGTAQIASPDGRYVDNEYISSFTGMLPARDPRFVALVVLERPQSRLLGTVTAMTAFRGLAEDLVRHARVEPDRVR